MMRRRIIGVVAGIAWMAIAASSFAPAALAADLIPKKGRGIAPPGTRDDGPWNTRIMLATSTNGLDFRREHFVLTDQAGVPNVVVDSQQRARVYYVDFGNGNVLACAVQDRSESLTNWSFRRVQVEGLPRQYRAAPVDPAVTILPDGRFRMYFVHAAPTPAIYSALSTNGFEFAVEPGIRLGGAEPVFDPTVLKVNDQWLLWAGPEGRSAARSTNGLDFTSSGEFRVEGARFMPWSAAALPGGGVWRLFGNFVGPGEWRGGVSSVFSADGKQWQREPGIRLSLGGSRYPLESRLFPDNGCARLPDGTWLMAYVATIPEPRGR